MRGRGAAALFVVGSAIVLAGCDAPTRPERSSPVESATFAAIVGADGVVSVQMDVEFETSAGGTVVLRAPTLATIDQVTVNGTPRPTVLVGTIGELPINAPRATVAFRLEGAVERFVDVAVVTVPVWTEVPEAKDTDPLVPVGGRVTLPTVPHENARWHGSIPVTRPRINGIDVVLDGSVAADRDSTAVVTFPPSAVPGLPVLLPLGPRAGYVEDRQAAADREDVAAASARTDAQQRVDWIARFYWVLVALEVAAPLLITAVRLGRAARKRLEAGQGVSEYLHEPPADDPPAVVALVANGGHDIGHEAVAATVLDLAQRRAIRIDAVAESRYVMHVEPGDLKERTGPIGAPVLTALRSSAGEDGELTGPPLGLGEGPWLRAFRRETLKQAKESGLLQRRLPSGVFIAAVVALFVTTFPLYAQSAEAGFAGFLVTAALAALPFVGGYVLSPKGEKARAQWAAFGRWVGDNSEITEAPPAAVAVWGPYLVYGVAVGRAEEAVRGLRA